ncbi:MAG: protein translocase subunit SecD [Arenicella sp.]
MNTNPFWKYLLLIAVLVPAFLYALPNVFDNDPGIQIIGKRNQEITQSTLETVESALSAGNVTVKSLEMNDDNIRVRFNDNEEQLKASELIKNALGNNYASALASMTSTPRWLQDLGAIPMYLGLDLRGGVHFLIQVDTEFAVERAKKSTIDDVRRLVREEKLGSLGAKSTGKLDFEVKFKSVDNRDRAERLVATSYPNLVLFNFERDGAAYLQVTISETVINDIKKSAIEKNMIALRNRIDELGVAEPIVQQQGLDRIVVQLPGVQDPAEARKIIGNTATLEVYLVDEKNAGRSSAPGSKRYFFRDGRPILLKKRLIYSGDCIVDAASGFGQDGGGSIVSITLNSQCRDINMKVTGENINKRMAIVYAETKTEVVVDSEGNQRSKKSKTEEVITAPVIRDQLGKRFQIDGMSGPKEAQELALLLRAGSLDTPVYIVEERTVGPNLGKESIEKGFKSVMYGFIAVLLFMLVYYRMFGGVASVALVLNLVIIVAVLSLFQATLTLPGVAGIVLTVGMAVDANVLIFERIREEIRAGSPPQTAIHSGYDRAFSTIIDANITTLVAALVLFNFGTGPIKGFAITLSIGILTSMFTAIFVSRVVVNKLYGGRKLDKLPI